MKSNKADSNNGQEAYINRPRVSPKDFFLYLAVIITLYSGTISFVNLIFNLINIRFPDQLSDYAGMGAALYVPDYSSAMKIEIATLIIMFPLFLLFSSLINRDIRRDAMKAELSLRRWLTSLTLFLAGIALVIDLITLIITFLNGELTTDFILKIIAVLIVAGGIFSYYLQDLRKRFAKNASKAPMTMAWIASIVVIAAIVGSFVIIGSPVTARDRVFDSERISDLQDIQTQVVSYWQENASLPSNLSVLNDPISGWTVPVDPENGAAFQYSIGTSSVAALPTFQLCAMFDLSSAQEQVGEGDASTNVVPVVAPSPESSPGYVPVASDDWQHDKGLACFSRTINPAQYPLENKSAAQ